MLLAAIFLSSGRKREALDEDGHAPKRAKHDVFRLEIAVIDSLRAGRQRARGRSARLIAESREFSEYWGRLAVSIW